MLKWLAMFALLLAVTPIVSCQPNQTPEKKQTIAPQSQPTVISPDGKDKQPSGHENQSTSGGNSPAGNTTVERSHWWFKSEWWLVIIAAATGGVIGWQSWETRKASQATQASADGVEKQSLLIKRQADAMDEQTKTTRNKERARLSICGLSEPEFQPAGSFLSDKATVPVVILIYVVNDGETTAFNVEAAGMLRIDSNFDEKFIPDGVNLNIPRTIKVMDQEHRIRVAITGLGAIKGAMTGEFTMIPEPLANDIREGTKFLRIMGIIKYDDVFGERHSTPFGYLWEVPAHDSTGHWVKGCRWLDESPRST